MEFDEKTLALAKHLEIEPALISNEYSHYYHVNERIIKHGKTPEQFKKTAEDFRSILDTGMQGLISATITSERTAVQIDEAYKEVKESLKPLAEKAANLKKREETTGQKLLGSKLNEARTYLSLQQDNLYVENVLYHLLKGNDKYADNLRDAWLGKPLNDNREDRTVNDGEYLVLTDMEADEWEREGLENLMDEQTYDVPEHLKRFIDTEKFIDEYSGNRGENISGYDGQEYEEEVNGTKYYIYRHN